MNEDTKKVLENRRIVKGYFAKKAAIKKLSQFSRYPRLKYYLERGD